MRTSFHHQPEAQHPNSSAIHKLAGRLPHLSGQSLRIYSASARTFVRCWPIADKFCDAAKGRDVPRADISTRRPLAAAG